MHAHSWIVISAKERGRGGANVSDRWNKWARSAFTTATEKNQGPNYRVHFHTIREKRFFRRQGLMNPLDSSRLEVLNPPGQHLRFYFLLDWRKNALPRQMVDPFLPAQARFARFSICKNPFFRAAEDSCSRPPARRAPCGRRLFAANVVNRPIKFSIIAVWSCVQVVNTRVVPVNDRCICKERDVAHSRGIRVR